jgi:hypothetical protein
MISLFNDSLSSEERKLLGLPEPQPGFLARLFQRIGRFFQGKPLRLDEVDFRYGPVFLDLADSEDLPDSTDLDAFPAERELRRLRQAIEESNMLAEETDTWADDWRRL